VHRLEANTDTPWPPEEPAGQNPPDGAVFDYYLKSASSGPATLEVLDSAGKLGRFASTDKPEEVNPQELEVPLYWVRSPQVLSAQPGMHRFAWDLHYPPPIRSTTNIRSRPSFTIRRVIRWVPPPCRVSIR
jgi:hypothetical protein